jgi:hypothetical protein
MESSKFCGGAYCDSCSSKQRANPENASEFARICGDCDSLYLQKRWLAELTPVKKAKEQKMEDIMSKLMPKQQMLTEMIHDLEITRAEVRFFAWGCMNADRMRERMLI